MLPGQALSLIDIPSENRLGNRFSVSFCSTFWTSKKWKKKILAKVGVSQTANYGIIILCKYLLVITPARAEPEIMLAIDFRGPFCSTFWTSKKWKELTRV